MSSSSSSALNAAAGIPQLEPLPAWDWTLPPPDSTSVSPPPAAAAAASSSSRPVPVLPALPSTPSPLPIPRRFQVSPIAEAEEEHAHSQFDLGPDEEEEPDDDHHNEEDEEGDHEEEEEEEGMGLSEDEPLANRKAHAIAALRASHHPAAPSATSRVLTPARPGPAAPSSPSSTTPSSARRPPVPSLEAYEVIELLSEDEEEEEEELGRRGPSSSSSASSKQKQKGTAVADAPDRPMPLLERFVIHLPTTGPVLSGRRLRHQFYPEFYPPTPPPTVDQTPTAMDVAPPAESKESEGAEAGANGKQKKKQRKKRKRNAIPDYYDVDDDFIDDSELVDDYDGPDADTDPLLAPHEHSLTPDQLQVLYAQFIVLPASVLEDTDCVHQGRAQGRRVVEEEEEDDFALGEGRSTEPSRKKKRSSKFVTPDKRDAPDSALSGKKKRSEHKDKEREREPNKDKGGDKEKDKEKDKGGVEGASTAPTGERKRKVRKDKGVKRKQREQEKEREREKTKTQEAAGTASQPMQLSQGDEATTAPSEHPPAAAVAAAASSSAVPPSPSSSLAAVASAVAAAPPPPPPSLGSLDKDWLSCFDKFPATPAVISLLEEIMAESKAVQLAAFQPPPAANPSLSQQSSEAANPTAAAAEGQSGEGEHKMEDVSDSTPTDSTAPSSSSSSSAVAPPTRPGLRHKVLPNLSITQPRPLIRLPDSMSKLLSRLGALLELEAAEDSTVNRFLTHLSRELIWSRKAIKDRLVVGRLEGQISKFLKERFQLYIRLREAINKDIDTQKEQMQKEAATAAASSSSAAPVPSLSTFYRPQWDSYMPLLLDFCTYTDDLTEALEELEVVQPKRAPGPAPAPGSREAETPEELTQARVQVLTNTWNAWEKKIPEEAYLPEHLPLLLSVTDTLYEKLPVLWQRRQEGEGGGILQLMSESEIEQHIDEAEQECQRKQEEEARKEQEKEEEAKRQAEEAKKAAEEAEAQRKRELDAKVAELCERERQRKKQKQPLSPTTKKERREKRKQEKAAAAAAAAPVSDLPIRSRAYCALPPPAERWKLVLPPPSPSAAYRGLAPAAASSSAALPPSLPPLPAAASAVSAAPSSDSAPLGPPPPYSEK